ncbi:MAG TPA: hypothetical protein VF182_17270 [Candidatus Binatia bacterium]
MNYLFTYFLFFIFLAATVAGWSWPYIAKLMPVYVAAIPGLILIIAQLARDAFGKAPAAETTGGSIDMDEVYDVKLEKSVEVRRTLIFFGWFIAGAVGIWLLGIVIALPVLVLLYTLIEGKESWITSLMMTVGTYLLIWGLFEYMLETRWPAGWLFGY